MFKVKDAFRRIAPSSKRKDTPAPLQASMAPYIIEESKNNGKDLFIFDELSESINEIDNKMSLPSSVSESFVSSLTVATTNESHCGGLLNKNNNKRSLSSSVSENCVSSLAVPTLDESHRKTSSNSINSLKESVGTKKIIRKNSSQKTRSAEDLVTLVRKSSSHKKSNKSRRAIMTHSYEPNKLLEKAIEESYVDLVEGLITSGQVNINKLNNEGFAPLHFATAEGKADIMQILIDCGAYIDILTNTGHSALEIAVADGSFDCAQVLIENGADQTFVLDGPLDPRCSREMSLIF